MSPLTNLSQIELITFPHSQSHSWESSQWMVASSTQLPKPEILALFSPFLRHNVLSSLSFKQLLNHGSRNADKSRFMTYTLFGIQLVSLLYLQHCSQHDDFLIFMPLFGILQWLPFSLGIKSKLINMLYKALYPLAQTYLSSPIVS